MNPPGAVNLKTAAATILPALAQCLILTRIQYTNFARIMEVFDA
jgi:hypothetical protein